ncbi:MAG: hypothetical protein LBL45_08790 [Treponema sp.]|jgi:hypothetical protein|nr:hypothetical protein [Treponema sp.]
MNVVETLAWAVRLPEDVRIRLCFSKDSLSGRISAKERRRLFDGAARCGIACSHELARNMGVNVAYPDREAGGIVPVFAQFVRPDAITLFARRIEKAARLFEENSAILPDRIPVENMLLAHELFHWIEEQQKDAIFTRKEKITLWQKPFLYKVAVSCLSEIAGMAFAQDLLGIAFCPFALDLLLAYTMDKGMSGNIYCYLKTFEGNSSKKQEGDNEELPNKKRLHHISRR